LSAIKKDLEFNTGLSSLLETLKMIAVSQYRSLEGKIRIFDRLTKSIEGFFKFIDPKTVNHPFLNPRSESQVVVAVTSDSGLLGGINRDVVNYALAELGKMKGKLIVVGDRGKIYARESGFPFTAFSGIIDEQRLAQALQLRDHILDNMIAEKVGYLKVVYPHPTSFTVQNVRVVGFLPFMASSDGSQAAGQVKNDVIFESRVEDMAEYLAYIWVGEKLNEIFGLSRLAEFAARFIHLEGSAQRIKDMDKKLRLQYFRVRHELIDRNMRELFSARILYASKKR
jgi:ATP synthase F1 gamma subunit